MCFIPKTSTFSFTDRDDILHEEKNHGHRDANFMLLDRLVRHNEHWYARFIRVLRQTHGYEALAAKIDEQLTKVGKYRNKLNSMWPCILRSPIQPEHCGLKLKEILKLRDICNEDIHVPAVSPIVGKS